jgi:hypothetical protein
VTVADEKQLKTYTRAVDVWNKWREDNPEEKIDLSVTNLSGAKLNGRSKHRALTNSTIGKLINTAKKTPPLLIPHVQGVM